MINASPFFKQSPPYHRLASRLLKVFLLGSGILSTQASVFYEIETVAKVGDSVDGDQITSIFREVSTNDKGEVAFVAALSGTNNGRGVIHGKRSTGPDGTFQLTRLGFIDASSGSLSHPQINNDNRIVARERVGLNSNIKIWEASTPSSGMILASSATSSFRSVVNPCLNEDGKVFFVGLDQSNNATLQRNTGIRDSHTQLSTLERFGPFPMAGLNDAWVIKKGTGFSSPVVYGNASTPGLVLAPSTSTNIGRGPGISRDGEIVAFLENNQIKIAVPGLGTRTVWDLNTAIAFDDSGNKVTFSSFDQESRIAVSRYNGGGAEAPVGDTLHLTFIATPSSASLKNPMIPGRPLLFSAAKGIWSLKIDIDKERLGTNDKVANPWGVLPVIQIGDIVNDSEVTGLYLYDPLGEATTNLDGTPRVPARNDHYLCFHANSASGDFVGMASRLDTDDDGLADHWEREGGGVDIDQDGTPELVLSEMGASVNKQDLFVEIDWTTLRTFDVPGEWDNYPRFKAIERVVEEFDKKGITLHVDAGPYLSKNMGTWPLEGSDIIRMPGTGNHLDHISLNSKVDLTTTPGLEAMTMNQVKDLYFGTEDKRARELVFRYCVYCDFAVLHSVGSPNAKSPYVGEVASAGPQDLFPVANFPTDSDGDIIVGCIKITSGTGAGQIRYMRNVFPNYVEFFHPWTTVPDSTSRFVIFPGNTGLSEQGDRKGDNNHTLPGNDLLVSLGPFYVKGLRSPGSWYDWRTLMHEVGHTLGLRHGGFEDTNNKPDYDSLMNYSHQLVKTSTVNSFSDPSDPSKFNDWKEIRLEAVGSLLTVGRTYGGSLGAEVTDEFEPHSYTFQDFLDDNGVDTDLTPPDVSLESPSEGTGLSSGETLNVIFSTNESILKASAAFDLNGDGVIDTASGEMVEATSLGANRYSVNFGTITGGDGVRRLFVFAEDNDLNEEEFFVDLIVGELSTDLADDDGDGLSNLIEEALGTDPNSADFIGEVLETGIDRPGDTPNLTLTYPRDNSQSGIEIQAQVSLDLLTWSSVGVVEEVLETNGNISRIKASAPGVAGDPEVYFRILVRRLP